MNAVQNMLRSLTVTSQKKKNMNSQNSMKEQQNWLVIRDVNCKPQFTCSKLEKCWKV